MTIYDSANAIIVTCRHKGFDDAATVSWHTPVSNTPFYYGIFLGKSRRTLSMIQESKVFCLNFLSKDMDRLVAYCGTHSGHSVDKIRDGKIAVQECDHIACPRLVGSLSYLECRALNFWPVGDHTMVVGEVVKSR